MKFEISNIANRRSIAPLILLGMIATYTLIIGTLAVNRFMSFNATFWDLGLMLQAIWNTAQGRILYESVNLGFSASRFTMAHWELIYLPLAIIYRIVPSVPLLLYTQSFVLACGAIPIYKFAAKKLSSAPAALLIASAYLFYPALHGANLFDLHGLTFATTFLLATFYFLDQSNLKLALLFGLACLSCREDIAFVIFMLGLYTIIFQPNKKIGLLFIFLSLCWLIAFSARGYFWGAAEVMSTANAGSNWDHLGQGGFLKLFISLLHHPTQVVQTLLQFGNLKYLAKLFLPVLGMSFFSPPIVLIAIPTLLLNLLSSSVPMHQIEYHYTATITPFIFLSAIQGLANLHHWLQRAPIFASIKSSLPALIAIDLLIASICSTMFFSIIRFHANWRVSEANRELAEQLHAIPSPLSVSATGRLGPHLASRPLLCHFPEHFQKSDIVILELNRPDVEIKNATGKQRTLRVPAWNKISQAAMQDSNFGLRFATDNVYCLQRGIDSNESFKQYAMLDSLPFNGERVQHDTLANGLIFKGWKTIYLGSQQAHFEIFWQKARQQNRDDQLELFLSFDDCLLSIDHQPVFGRLAWSDVPIGTIVRDHLFVDRPRDHHHCTFSIAAQLSSGAPQPLFTFRFPPQK